MVRIHRSEAMSKKGKRVLKDTVFALVLTFVVHFFFDFIGVSTEPPAIWLVIFFSFLLFISASRVIY